MNAQQAIDSESAAAALAGHFPSRYPGYPVFQVSVPTGRGNFAESVKRA